jgi:hypothetical protein
LCSQEPKPEKLTFEEQVKLSAEAPNLGMHIANRLVGTQNINPSKLELAVRSSQF